MDKKLICIIIVIFALLIGGWFRFYYSDKAVIKRDFTKLATEISKQKQETSIQMALKMKKVKNHLHNPCKIIIPERRRDPLESDLIIRYLMFYRQQYTEIGLTFTNLEVDLPIDGKAVVETTVHLIRKGQSEVKQNGEKLVFFLRKYDAIWHIDKVVIPAVFID